MYLPSRKRVAKQGKCFFRRETLGHFNNRKNEKRARDVQNTFFHALLFLKLRPQ